MDVMPSGSVTETKFRQLLNAFSPIDVVELGMLIDARAVSANAKSPIDWTDSGILMEVKFVQPQKVSFSINVMPSGRAIEVSCSQ